MVNRIKILILIAIFFLSGSTLGHLHGEIVKVGPYVGFFMTQDDLVEEIYGGKDVTYGLKLGVHIWKGFYGYVSAQQCRLNAATVLGDITRLHLTPIHLSLRYTFNLGTVNPYLGGGYTFIYFKEEADIGNTDDSGSGYALNAGFEFKITDRFILDLGARYSKLPVNPSGLGEIDLGGIEFGISFLTIF